MAVVGAGFTGLWTAYYLAEADPCLRIAVIERRVGRLRRLGPQRRLVLGPVRRPRADRLDGSGGPGAGAAMRRAMVATVDEVGRVVAAEPIECGFAHGGTVVLARNRRPAAQRARGEVATARASGVGEDDSVAVGRRGGGPGRGRRRARGDLHASLRRRRPGPPGARSGRGGRGAGASPSTSRPGPALIRPGAVETATGARCGRRSWCGPPRGTRATLPGEERTLVPVYSLMIATEPLPDLVLGARSGWPDRETFADHRHLIIYGQRTDDGRMAFGGRGAPYHFGSAIRPRVRSGRRRARGLRTTLVEPVPGAGRRGRHPPLGRPPGHRPRLVHLGRLRPGRPAWPGPAATSVTGCPPPTWPVAPCAT